MRPVPLTLLACLLAAPTLADTGERPTLRLIPDQWTTQVGDSVTLYLVLEVPDAATIVGDDSLTFSNRSFRSGERIDGPAMTMSLNFRPKEPGFTELGPYTLTLGNETYTSEVREIQVFPDWEPGEVGFRWQLSHELVAVGQPFGLTVRQRVIGVNAQSNYLQVTQRYRNHDAPFQVSGGGSSSSTNTVNGERVRTTDQHFTITPKQPGELHITRNVFDKLPEDVELPELIVDVVEK